MRLRLWKPRADSATSGRFELVSERYARFRPSYAASAIDSALRGLDRSACRIADVGAGTGIASRQIASAIEGASMVDAVEPNDAMRAAAEAHPRVRWHPGKAERTGLPSGRFDVVVCAQAFHWFETAAALDEFARLLKPGGRLVILNNRCDLNNALTAEFRRIVDEALGPHYAERHGNGRASIRVSTLFRDYATEHHANVRAFDAEGFVGYARSSSRYGGEIRDTLDRRLIEAYRRHADADGLARFAWITEVHSAVRAP